MAIAETTVRATEDKMKELLAQTFQGKIVFNPVTVEPATDHYGDDNLEIVVVYEGDDALLDPNELNAISSKLGDVLYKLGFLNIPVESYIAKDEYPEWVRLNSLPTPWLDEQD